MPEREIPEEFIKQIENSETVEISPDTLKVVMDKIQDINEVGTAFHVIGLDHSQGSRSSSDESIQSALENGLLGWHYNGERGDTEEWTKNVRQRKYTPLFFNIIGRDSRSAYSNITRMEDSYWVKNSENSATIIFDATAFKEYIQNAHKKQGNTKTYTTQHQSDAAQPINMWRKSSEEQEYQRYLAKLPAELREEFKYEMIAVHDDDGFVLFSRVAPRFFKGICLKIENGENGSTEIQKKIEAIIKVMKKIFGEHKELYIPIYDIHGNLLWPKFIEHEQVKAMSAQQTDETLKTE